MPETELESEELLTEELGTENETPSNETATDEPEHSERKEVDVKSLLAQKEHWRKKAEEYRSQISSKPVAYDPLEPVRIGKMLASYDEQETSFILEHAKGTTAEAISRAVNNPYVQAGIQSLRGKVADKGKVPSSSSASSDSFNDEKSNEEIAEMTDTQFAAYEKKMSKKQIGI